MRAYLSAICISRRYRLMSLLSLALVVFCPSAGGAIPSFPEFFPELTSGSVSLETGGGFTLGRATVTSEGTMIRVMAFAPVGGSPFPLNPASKTIFWQIIDPLIVGVTHPDQTFTACRGAGVFPVFPCAEGLIFTLSMGAPQPPPPVTPVDSRLTVPGTFGLDLSVRIILSDSNFDQQGPFLTFDTSGPASITLRPAFGVWSFDSGFAEFEPTPEPATLLLFGTTAAGLGLARWYRRRTRGHEHESPSVP
jgi:hypothetical protein